MKGLFSWATVVLLGFVSLFFIMKLFSYFQPKPSLPPSPMALPVIGHFHLIGYRVHQSFHKLSAILRPLFHVMLGSVPFIVASDAAAARDILREHEKCFVDRKTAETITRTGSLKELQWIRKEEVRKLLGLLYEKAERRQEWTSGRLLRGSATTGDQMMNSGGSDDCHGHTERGGLRRILWEHRSAAAQKEGRQGSLQLRQSDGADPRGGRAARKENSVKTAVAETIHHLRDARREIESVVGLSRLVEESDVPNLPLLHTIVKETLRLHPAFPIISRHSNAPCKIRGYSIPPTPESRSTFGFSRRCSWSVGRSFGVDVKGQHFHLLPFGTGRRMCPGMSLALQLIHTTLANVMQCFELSIVGGMAEMTEGHGASLPRAHRLVGTPKARIKFLP
ncbi:unnamed protein product [Spirodela intermedia]|uniref:Uncharacterized protein n=1 Tax=Spirodela intermedia TaxID=51605 RepID=A0A7I8JQ98_SPIIN|nr:unnamed protein product [Spirodela intermedia]CAA6672348.1 unnamed protein product [Spirodela intermedia]